MRTARIITRAVLLGCVSAKHMYMGFESWWQGLGCVESLKWTRYDRDPGCTVDICFFVISYFKASCPPSLRRRDCRARATELVLLCLTRNKYQYATYLSRSIHNTFANHGSNDLRIEMLNGATLDRSSCWYISFTRLSRRVTPYDTCSHDTCSQSNDSNMDEQETLSLF